MKCLFLMILVGFSVNAQNYEAPADVPKMDWKKSKIKYYQENEWKPEGKISDAQAPVLDPEADESSPERKPSSGEEVKPKFWDFKVVK